MSGNAALAPLSLTERRDLAALEMVVSQGIDAFREVGSALAEIRDRRLYRQTHKTFEDYCRVKWGFSKRHGDRLIAANAVAEELGPIGPIANEAHARALAAFPPHLRESIYREALATAPDGKLTAAWIMRVGTTLAGGELEEPDEEEEDDEDSLDSGESDSPDSDGDALSDAADRCTEPPRHAVEKAADHVRKAGMHLRHCTDIDVARALQLHAELTDFLAPLVEKVKSRKTVTATVVDSK